jgi:hypothetical protein
MGRMKAKNIKASESFRTLFLLARIKEFLPFYKGVFLPKQIGQQQ